MHRSFAVATGVAAIFLLGACGSDTTDGGPDVPDDADVTATQPTAQPDDSPTTTPVTTPDAPAETGGERTTIEESAATTVASGTEGTGSSASDGGGTASTPERLGTLAATDLAARLDIGVDEIDVLAVDEVTWPDASLGCPQKDFQYAQVLTPGIRIELSAQGRTFAYHAGDGRDPFYCADPQRPV